MIQNTYFAGSGSTVV